MSLFTSSLQLDFLFEWALLCSRISSLVRLLGSCIMEAAFNSRKSLLAVRLHVQLESFKVLAIREVGSALEINLITGVNQNCLLYEIFSVLREEGAEVLTAS
ncbi:unnamed protein product [Ilex paraguariensis]|uniref:Uncharacterized protein n=1 Tax=Ilex paraguariensis TaxID=185542 RepID=A0ABC8QUL1_9AQUA